MSIAVVPNTHPFLCLQCDAGFKLQEQLDAHMELHSQSRPFVCHQCDAGFKAQGQLDAHMKLHLLAPSSFTTNKPTTLVCPTAMPSSDHQYEPETELHKILRKNHQLEQESKLIKRRNLYLEKQKVNYRYVVEIHTTKCPNKFWIII